MAIKFLFSGIKGEGLRSMNLNELIYNENSLLMKMRMDNYFDNNYVLQDSNLLLILSNLSL